MSKPYMIENFIENADTIFQDMIFWTFSILIICISAEFVFNPNKTFGNNLNLTN